MRKIIIFLIFLKFSFNVFAQGHNVILATVNGSPVTDYDLQERKTIIRIVNNVDNVSVDQDIQLTKTSLESLIEEQLLFQYAMRIKKMPTSEQVKLAFASIEKNNGLSDGGLIEVIKEKGGSVESLTNKIRADIIKMTIMSQIAESINVSSKEVEVAILNGINKDATVNAVIYTSLDKSLDTYAEMLKLAKNLKNGYKIDQNQYMNFAIAHKVNCKLSKLDNVFKLIIKDLDNNKVSKIFETDNGFNIILLCNKVIDNISKKENELVVDFIANKKINKKANKIFSDLKNTAVIEKFIVCD